MTRGGWKAVERRMAKDVGTTRIPVSGRTKGEADFENDRFSFQLKVRKSLPAWLWGWLYGIQEVAVARRGVLVLKTPGMKDEDAIVVMSWSDFLCATHSRMEKHG
mgnify:CR=1 FL=1